MSQTVGDFFWHRMHEWGVHTIFGYPGDGINGLLGALNRADDQFKFVQTRHEEMAAFMASAYAKFTGEVGVCMATSGPGASHLITGLYDARMDHMPVLAITGQQARTAIGGHYQQELDLPSMFKDVAGAFCLSGECSGAGASSGGSGDADRERFASSDCAGVPERPARGGVF